MAVSLSIKDVPEALARRLRERAQRNHRSLQRELMAIVETAALGPAPAPAPDADPAKRIEEPEASSATAPRHPGKAAGAGSEAAQADGLLAELDRIVEGSRWGQAPLLTRDQLHDRALARELDFDAREAELRQARAAGSARSR